MAKPTWLYIYIYIYRFFFFYRFSLPSFPFGTGIAWVPTASGLASPWKKKSAKTSKRPVPVPKVSRVESVSHQTSGEQSRVE